MPSSLARELAHMALAAGATSWIQLDACQTFQVADSYQCYFVPVQTPPAPTFGQTGAHAPGYRYSYVWCHGTDISTAALILKELQVRPTMPGSGINTGSEINFPAVAFYCQASVGEFDLRSVQTAVAKELRISKGLQGMLIMGECHTVQSHLKVSWSDTVEESRLCFRRGAIRTPRIAGLLMQPSPGSAGSWYPSPCDASQQTARSAVQIMIDCLSLHCTACHCVRLAFFPPFSPLFCRAELAQLT